MSRSPAGVPVLRTRQEFRRFVLAHHPDRGGDAGLFAAGVAAWRARGGAARPPDVVFYRKRTLRTRVAGRFRSVLRLRAALRLPHTPHRPSRRGARPINRRLR